MTAIATRTQEDGSKGEAGRYLVPLAAQSSMSFVPLILGGLEGLPNEHQATHVPQRPMKRRVVVSADRGLQSGTTALKDILRTVPEGDASVPEKVPGLGEVEMAEESAVKGDGFATTATLNAVLLATLNLLVGACAFLFWNSFTLVRDDVRTMQRDVGEIKVAATATNGKIDLLGATLNGKIDGLGGKIDGLAASNVGQFQMISERLDDLRAAPAKPK